jgi:hypothetical protein
MNELDFGCRCPGADTRYVECNNAATQEDGLCDNCRERDCPNTPLAWFMRQMEAAIADGDPVMQEIHDEYLRRCKEANTQP